jgi:hypothetical protein
MVGGGDISNESLGNHTLHEQRDVLLKEAKLALKDSQGLLDGIEDDLKRAKEVAALAGLSIDSRIVEVPKEATSSDGDASTKAANTTNATTTTGGYSNTDHIIVHTGDRRVDRIAELKRALLRRTRSMMPENRKDERWDKPKAPGERRRKIVLEKDLDESPPEPPATGWMIFLGQMTTKYRHDDPMSHHDQARALTKIGTIWKSKFSEEEREYYQDFATEARKEYQRQVIEYRATGSYQPSQRFAPLQGTNIWVRLDNNSCALEREISSYETVRFAPRPPELNEAYEERQLRSIVKRKLKVKNLLDKDGNPKKGVDFEKLMNQERNRHRTRKREEGGKSDEAALSSSRHSSAMSESGNESYEWQTVN